MSPGLKKVRYPELSEGRGYRQEELAYPGDWNRAFVQHSSRKCGQGGIGNHAGMMSKDLDLA